MEDEILNALRDLRRLADDHSDPRCDLFEIMESIYKSNNSDCQKHKEAVLVVLGFSTSRLTGVEAFKNNERLDAGPVGKNAVELLQAEAWKVGWKEGFTRSICVNPEFFKVTDEAISILDDLKREYDGVGEGAQRLILIINEDPTMAIPIAQNEVGYTKVYTVEIEHGRSLSCTAVVNKNVHVTDFHID